MPDGTAPQPYLDQTAPAQAGANAQVSPPASLLSSSPSMAGVLTSPPPGPPQAQKPVSPAAAQAQHGLHLASVGSGVKKILGAIYGTGYEPQMQPDGTIKETQVHYPPNTIFKHILAGAILGGATAARLPAGERTFGAGMTVGAEGAREENQRLDALKREQLNQQFQRGQELKRSQLEQDRLNLETDRFNAENQHWQAQLAFQTQQQLMDNFKLNLQAQDHIDLLNNEANKDEQQMRSLGVPLANIPGNGEHNNGEKMMELYNKNPKAFQPSPEQIKSGYGVKTIQKIDYTGLHVDPEKGGWVDEKGNKTDLRDRTTWSVYFAPPDAREAVTMRSGASLMKAYPHVFGNGSLDPSKNYPINMGQELGISQENTRISSEIFAMNFREQHETAMEVYRLSREKIDGLKAELSAASREGTDPDAVKRLSKELEDANKQSTAILGKMNPQLREILSEITAPAVPPPGANAAPSTLEPVDRWSYLKNDLSSVVDTLNSYNAAINPFRMLYDKTSGTASEAIAPKVPGLDGKTSKQIFDAIDRMPSETDRINYINKLTSISPQAKANLIKASTVPKAATTTTQSGVTQVQVKTSDGQIGTIPSNRVNQFLTDNPGSSVVR